MLTVYAIPVSLYCAKLRILLRHKGLEWEEVPPPGGYGSDEYKSVVPSGNLPAMRDGDLLLCDSEAIAEYLEETHPDPPMLPADIRARAMARDFSRFHDTRLEPAVRALFPYLPGRAAAPDGFPAAQSGAISARLEQLSRLQFNRFLTEDEMQALHLGDCGYPITFAWIDALAPRMGLDIRWPLHARTYRDGVEQVPAVEAELADYLPKLAAFLDG